VKRIQRRKRATADLSEALAYYFEAAGPDLAERFLLAYEAAVAHVARHPGTGSRRYAKLIKNAELRFWTLKPFPYAVFYLERDDVIDVLRVLHQAQDIPAHLDL
jgi:toxin ParE1/3/4